MNALEQNLELIEEHLIDYKSQLPLFYQFEYHGINFDCQIVNHDSPDHYYVNLTARIGYLPYSSENKNRRELILKNFSHLMAHNLITIDHHCDMKLPLNTMIKGDINAKTVMETICYTLLDANEVLEIISNTMNDKNINTDQNLIEKLA